MQDIVKDMPAKSILLSELEREVLTDPKKLSDRQKRNLKYRLKTRCVKIDQALQEIRLLLENCSEDSIKENVSNKTLDNLMAIFENLLQALDPWPIGVTEDGEGVMAYKVFGNAIPSADPGKCAIFSVSRTATIEEVELDFHLTNHFNKIRRYVDPCVPDPVCRNTEYVGTLRENIFKTANDLAKPFLLSSNTYFDETGISETGWVMRKPSMVDIDQLQWMRWKPRELEDCMEQPPLLAPKDIPRGPELMHLTIHNEEEGTHYSISEKGGEERSITKEEFLKTWNDKERRVETSHPKGEEPK
jgi:hypothetical protein